MKKKDSKSKCLPAGLLVVLVLILAGYNLEGRVAFAQEGRRSKEIIGEAFGELVAEREFYYYYKTALLFTRTGKQERTEDETIDEAWQNLIFRKEAGELNITVSRKELEEELKRLLFEKDVEYGTNDYKIWTMTELDEDVEVFEHRIEDLLIIKKFMNIKTDPELPPITDEELEQKFRNQYNSFESEYIRFETREEVDEFAQKVKKDPSLWKKTYDEKKPDGQKGASWINSMSLEALIDLWKIPKDDAYRIIEHREGSFVSAKFYYGDAVFRLLNKKRADMSKYNEKKKQYYIDALTKGRTYKIVKDYFEDLLKRANYKDYIAQERREKKKEALKEKANIVIETNRGDIEVKLFVDTAPKACENFIGLVEKGYYDGFIFHRVIKDFMIQSGDPNGNGTGGESIWGKPFRDEVASDVEFDREGLLAMANSGANTNKSQFFITTKEAPWLNMKHTIFGEVVSGYDAVKAIENSPTGSSNKPKQAQKIERAYIKKE